MLEGETKSALSSRMQDVTCCLIISWPQMDVWDDMLPDGTAPVCEPITAVQCCATVH